MMLNIEIRNSILMRMKTKISLTILGMILGIAATGLVTALSITETALGSSAINKEHGSSTVGNLIFGLLIPLQQAYGQVEGQQAEEVAQENDLEDEAQRTEEGGQVKDQQIDQDQEVAQENDLEDEAQRTEEGGQVKGQQAEELAQEEEFRECDLGGVVRIETEDNKRFEIEQDVRRDVDVEPEDVCEDTDAKDPKNFRLKRGETITVSGIGGGDTERVVISLSGIGNIFECNDPECNPPFEVEIPDDIDKGKYTIRLRTEHDGADLIDTYISKLKIK